MKRMNHLQIFVDHAPVSLQNDDIATKFWRTSPHSLQPLCNGKTSTSIYQPQQRHPMKKIVTILSSNPVQSTKTQ